jgi:Swiss Army Knife RNA repair-like protein
VKPKEPPIEFIPAEAADSHNPLLLVDIDGVLSLFGGEPQEQGGAFHLIDGIPHFLSSTAAAHLLALEPFFELVWASGWEERANDYLPELLGLPAGLPFIRFTDELRGTPRTLAHWKLEAIEQYAGARPLAWIDDAFNDACHEWAASRGAPTLLVNTQPERGLTAREAQLLLAWTRELQGIGEPPG